MFKRVLFSERLTDILEHGSTHRSNIDPRKPMGRMSEEIELISLILAKVSVVDKVLGVKRDAEEWESLRELLYAYGVCDESGEVYSERSVNEPQKTYGQYRTDIYDLLTPIGYFSSCFTSRASLDPNDINVFDEISEIDGATYQIKRSKIKSGRPDLIFQERVAFMLDITFLNEKKEKVQYVMDTQSINLIGSGGVLLYIEYYASGKTDESQCEIWDELNSITKTITAEYDADALSPGVTGYPSPRGIEAVGFALQRPWKWWKGVGIARTQIVYDALCEIANQFSSGTTKTGFEQNIKTYSKWNGVPLEPEVIALSRGIRNAPSSISLMLYLSAICNLSPFDWERISTAKNNCNGRRRHEVTAN